MHYINGTSKWEDPLWHHVEPSLGATLIFEASRKHPDVVGQFQIWNNLGMWLSRLSNYLPTLPRNQRTVPFLQKDLHPRHLTLFSRDLMAPGPKSAPPSFQLAGPWIAGPSRCATMGLSEKRVPQIQWFKWFKTWCSLNQMSQIWEAQKILVSNPIFQHENAILKVKSCKIPISRQSLWGAKWICQARWAAYLWSGRWWTPRARSSLRLPSIRDRRAKSLPATRGILGILRPKWRVYKNRINNSY